MIRLCALLKMFLQTVKGHELRAPLEYSLAPAKITDAMPCRRVIARSRARACVTSNLCNIVKSR